MRMFFGPFKFLIPQSMTTKPWQTVHQVFDYFTEKTLRATRQQEDELPGGQLSVMETLTLQTRDKLEIRNQALHAMMGAQDTVPMLVSNTLFCLSRNSEIWGRLRAEVASVTPDTLTIEEARKSKLLRHILSECTFHSVSSAFAFQG